MKKRLLAMMMAFVMAMSLLPMSALAVGGGDAPEPSAPANAEGLEVSKIATANDGTYTLTMEAYTTGTVTSSTSSKPCDIVLVLDQSISMKDEFSQNQTVYEPVYASQLEKKKTYYVGYNEVRWCHTCSAWTSGCRDRWFFGHQVGKTYVPKTSADDATSGHVQFTKKVDKQRVTRLEAMKSAAVQFVNQVAAQDHNHRIAIVGFHDTAIVHTDFLDAATQATTLTNKINGISNGDLDYATEHGKGLAKATKLLTGATSSEDREKVVILFTDGEPEPMGKNTWSGRIVKQAIGEAYTLKNTYSASVYCISVLPGDDAEMNKYMNAISSNYPSANYTGEGDEVGKDTVALKINLNTPAADEGYYLKATNISELEEHFQKITTDVITPAISLDTTTVLKDVVTEYFTPGEDNVVVKTVPCTGKDETTGAYTWGNPTNDSTITATLSGNTVTVTGFDYDENVVAVSDGGKATGKKLVVEVKVTPKEGFWGGNNVPTNAGTSGIYDKDGKIVEAFPVPQVNVPLRVSDLKGKNVNIYCGNTAPAITDLVDQDGAFITDQGTWKTDFVIVGDVALKDGSGPISNVGDGNYTFGATVTPKYEATTNVGVAIDMRGVYKQASGSVYVFKPTITFKDTTIEKGTSADYSNNLVNTVWKHGDTLSKAVTMQGAEPKLSLTYSPSASEFTEDTNVAVTKVQNGSTDIKDYTTFSWQKNTGSSQCAADAKNCVAAPEGHQFRVHVVDTTPILTPANITISKQVDVDTPAPGQTVTYSITLTNSGETAGTVTVVDTLPTNLNVAPTDISDSGSYSTGKITWTGISVSGETPKTLTYRVKIPDNAEPGTTYNNTVKIGDGGTDKEATKIVTVTAAKLTASKTAPATVAPGGQLKYEITVSNSGNAPAENVVITDAIPDGLTLVQEETSISDGGQLGADSKTITWNNVTVPAANSEDGKLIPGTQTVSFTVTVPTDAANGTKYTNFATVTKGPDKITTETVETVVDNLSATISGTKVVKQGGNVAAPADAEFTFTLSQVIEKETTVVQTKNGGAGDFTFNPIRYTEAGTYVYEVKETAGSAANWTYDNTTYTVTVTVSPDKDGSKLVVSAPVYSVGDTKADKMTFTNTYTKNESTGGGGHTKPPVLNKEDHYAYIVGYPNGTVQPQGNITRAEVATIFFRMLTDDSRNEFWSQTNSYSDVSEGQWFNNAISTLANAGILSGYPDGTFRPNAPITRAEFTKIAASFFERVEYTIDNPFNDVDDDDWFYKFVMAAYEGGLITGYPEGDFRPNANISRAESVTIVNRTLERAPDADHFLKDMIVWPDNAENAWYYEAVQEATNSHEYVVKGTGTNKYEEWTKILEVRDWPALEKDWSNANSAAGGEVVK